MVFLFPRWDMLIPQRVYPKEPGALLSLLICVSLLKIQSNGLGPAKTPGTVGSKYIDSYVWREPTFYLHNVHFEPVCNRFGRTQSMAIYGTLSKLTWKLENRHVSCPFVMLVCPGWSFWDGGLTYALSKVKCPPTSGYKDHVLNQLEYGSCQLPSSGKIDSKVAKSGH